MAFPFLQLLFNSFISGSIYALVAVGFSLVYSTHRFMHLAHGVSVTGAGYLLFMLFMIWNIPFSLAVVITLVVTAFLGYGMYQLVYFPLQQKNSSTVILLIASIALLILGENIILALFGAEVKAISLIETSQGMTIGEAIITPLQVIIIVTSLILFVVLYFLLKKTKLGRNLRAVADNQQLAAIMGLNIKRIMIVSLIVGSMLGGVAGILIGLEQNINPTMGTKMMIKGFSGAVVGGILSVPGSIMGSYLIGLAENFGVWYLPSGFKDAIAFLLLFLFLLFKPSGLFGIDQGVKR